MAEKKPQGISGDWTAGIMAIVAAVLLGGGVPIGLYMGLYTPKKQERIAAEGKLKQVETEMNIQVDRQKRVNDLTQDAAKVEEWVRELETPFSDPSQLRVVQENIRTLCGTHNLRVPQDRLQSETNPEAVRATGERIPFKDGLQASQLVIHVTGTYHDFARFFVKLESMTDALVIPEALIMLGDQSQGRKHVFLLSVFVVEKRDYATIGR